MVPIKKEERRILPVQLLLGAGVHPLWDRLHKGCPPRDSDSGASATRRPCCWSASEAADPTGQRTPG
eukprot:12892498-Prorocentrum_lima.AAC.1